MALPVTASTASTVIQASAMSTAAATATAAQHPSEAGATQWVPQQQPAMLSTPYQILILTPTLVLTLVTVPVQASLFPFSSPAPASRLLAPRGATWSGRGRLRPTRSPPARSRWSFRAPLRDLRTAGCMPLCSRNRSLGRWGTAHAFSGLPAGEGQCNDVMQDHVVIICSAQRSLPIKYVPHRLSNCH